jgi:hypothetical protein
LEASRPQVEPPCSGSIPGMVEVAALYILTAIRTLSQLFGNDQGSSGEGVMANMRFVGRLIASTTTETVWALGTIIVMGFMAADLTA